MTVLIAQRNVCFAKILAALSYFSQYKSRISTYTDAMKNNHISQFSQFLRALARQQASWDGKHTTVIDRTILFTGANGTYCVNLSAAEVGEVCKRTRRLWVVLRNGSNTSPASMLQTCRQTVHRGSVLFDGIITTRISSIYKYIRTVTCQTIVGIRATV
jgi:hypothetical protein